MAIIRVGINKDYTNINTAIGTASEGDIILIDPGDYDYTVTIDKPVHLVGDTEDVLGNIVNISNILFTTCISTKTTKIIIEKLYLYYNGTGVYVVQGESGWDKKVEVVFNKCSMDRYYCVLYVILYWYSDAKLTIINCDLVCQRFNTEVGDGDTRVSIVRSLIHNLYYPVELVYQDYVTSPAVGYGCDYGYSYFKLPSKYYFQGIITEELVPVARTIKAYRRDNDVIMAQTTSDSITGAYRMVTEYSGEHYLICRDDPSGEQYNDLVRALVVPALEDYEENQWTHSDKFTLTIDHNLVGEEQFDFPLLIKLNASSGTSGFNTTDIFTNLNSFASRWSLQTDNNQQLYIEIIKWDYINQECIAWTQVPLIKSGEDTVLTLYYNALLPNNAFNIGTSSNQLTSHLWGTSCIGTWHMEEDPSDSDDVRDSTYLRHHATPYNLGSLAHKDGYIGKAIDFNYGYLKVEDLPNSLTPDMTLMSLVKLDNTNDYSTIFFEGSQTIGWEVCVENGKLISSISTFNDYIKEIYTTVTGNEFQLVSAVVDTTNSSMKLYIDGVELASSTYSYGIASYIGSDVSTIGTSYVSSVFKKELVPGISSNIDMPITVVSGVVVSGTVFMLESTGSYYDQTGRHTLTAKKPADNITVSEYKKMGEGSFLSYMGTADADPINRFNYTTINDNEEDFGFIKDQDFTISCWLMSSLPSTRYSSTYVSVLGDVSGSRSSCLSLTKLYYEHYDWPYTYYRNYFQLTIPTTSGTFVVEDQTIYGHYTVDSDDLEHIALVRYNGTIRFYFNGVEQYSVYAPDEIPSTTTVSGTIGTAVFSSTMTPDFTTSDFSCLNSLEVIKGHAQWNSNFDLIPPEKNEPNTFFSGQMDEVMLYSEVKTSTYIGMFNKSIKDELITYT